jgi:hypothetical protein
METSGNLALKKETSSKLALPAIRTRFSSTGNARCIVILRQERWFNSINLHLYHYAGNNPVRYIDPNGKDIKEIPLYNISIGLVGALRFTVGVAIDSNANIAIYMKFEGGIGFGITAVDESVINILGLSKINDIGTLYDSLKVIADTTEILKLLPDDTGKGNLDELAIEDYFINKIPVSDKKRNYY